MTDIPIAAPDYAALQVFLFIAIMIAAITAAVDALLPKGRAMTISKPAPEPAVTPPTPLELVAAFVSVRALVNARAGWYASMISDDMVREVVADALAAAAKVRAGVKP